MEEEDHVKKSMEKILKKFSKKIIFKNGTELNLTQIKDYKSVYKYKGKKYNINSIDYVYIFEQGLSNMSKIFNYSTISDSLYMDINENMLGIKKTKNSFFGFGRTITLKRKDEDNIFFRDDLFPIDISVIENNQYSSEFIDYSSYIFDQLFNKNIKFFSLFCRMSYKNVGHAELLFFQISRDTIYIINYDPSVIMTEGTEMFDFINFLSDILEQNLKNNNLSHIQVKKIFKNEMSIDIEKNISGLQKLSDNLKLVQNDFGNPAEGICEIFCHFMMYCLIYINYSTENTYLCNELIMSIETYICIVFFGSFDEIKLFSNLIINFASYITDYYYNYSIFQITSIDEKNQNIIKQNFQKVMVELTDMFFENYLKKHNFSVYEEKIDPETLKHSGYFCQTNSECISDNCVNNHCYIDEKEVNIDDIRSSGNPCLYNTQCKTRNCIDNVCIGDDNYRQYSKEEIPEYYDDELTNLEMLDMESLEKYKKNI